MARVCRILLLSSQTLLFVLHIRALYALHILNHSMSNIIINHFHISGNYYDIHDNPSVSIGQDVPTSASSTNDASIEDVTPIVEHVLCPFVVKEKLTELGLYTPEQFESMFREAAESDAKTLATFLKKYRQMGVLDFNGKDKKQIFAILRSSFPSMK